MHSRIERDNTVVDNLLPALTTTFVNLSSPEPLLSISSGILVPDNTTKDLMVAQEKGEVVMNKFI